MQTAAPALEFAGFADEIQRIGQEAVQEAQENLRRKGIPLCFSRNGRIYYEMPDRQHPDRKPLPRPTAGAGGRVTGAGYRAAR